MVRLGKIVSVKAECCQCWARLCQHCTTLRTAMILEYQTLNNDTSRMHNAFAVVAFICIVTEGKPSADFDWFPALYTFILIFFRHGSSILRLTVDSCLRHMMVFLNTRSPRRTQQLFQSLVIHPHMPRTPPL
jgi:hypothetical protein